MNIIGQTFSYTEGSGSGSGCQGDCRECGCPDGQGCFPVSESIGIRGPNRSVMSHFSDDLDKNYRRGTTLGPVTYTCLNDSGCKDLPDGFVFRDGEDRLVPWIPDTNDPTLTPSRGFGPHNLQCAQCLPAGPNGQSRTIFSDPILCAPPLKANATTVGREGQNIDWPPGTGPNTHIVDTNFVTCQKFESSKHGFESDPPILSQSNGGTPCPIIPKPPGGRIRTISSRAFTSSSTNDPTFIHNSVITISNSSSFNQQTLISNTQADIENTIGGNDPTSVESATYTSQPQSLEYSSQTLDGGGLNAAAQSVDPDILDTIIDSVTSSLCANEGVYIPPPCGSGETYIISTGSCEPTNNIIQDSNTWPENTLQNLIDRVDTRVQTKRKNRLLTILVSNTSPLSGSTSIYYDIVNITATADNIFITDETNQSILDEKLQSVRELETVFDDPNYETAEDYLAAIIKALNKVKNNLSDSESGTALKNVINTVSSSFTDVYTELLVGDCETSTYPDTASLASALAVSAPYLLVSSTVALPSVTFTSSGRTQSAYSRFRQPKPACTPPKVKDFVSGKCVCPDGYYNCDNATSSKEADCIKCLPPKVLFNDKTGCGCKCPPGQVECKTTGGCMPECQTGLTRTTRAPCGECVCTGSSLTVGGALGAGVAAGVPLLTPIIIPLLPFVGVRPYVINDATCNSRIPGSVVSRDENGSCSCVCPSGLVPQQCKASGWEWETDPYGGFRCTEPCYAPLVWDSETCDCACPSPGVCEGWFIWDDTTCECVCPSGADCGSGWGEN